MKSVIRQPFVIAGLIVAGCILPATVGEAWINYGRGGGKVLSASVQHGALFFSRETVVESGLFPTSGVSLMKGEWDIGSGYTGNRDSSPQNRWSLPKVESGMSDSVGKASYTRFSIPLWFLSLFLIGIGVGFRLVRERSAT